MSPRLLVTGGSGYLGSALLRAAGRLGWHALGTTRASPARPDLRTLDLTDHASVARLLAELAPDVVVHTAYDKSPEQVRAVVVEGTRAVARGARDVGARLVHVSSDAVFSGDLGRAYREDDVSDPVNGYGEAKAAAELAVTECLPSAAIVRTSLLIGGRSASGALAPPSLHELLAADPGASFYSDAVRCPVQVDDLAAALIELAESQYAGPLHVAGPEALSRADLAELVVGREVLRRTSPPSVPLDVRLDCGRAVAMLRTRLRPASEVLSP